MAPFTVLHVCMGNICRSPMAERLLARAVRDRAGDGTEPLVRSVSAGTGGWHEGEEMNPPAARQVRARRGSTDGFEARKLRGGFIDEADLILTATADQYDYVVALRPEAAARTFVLGEFGRLLNGVDAAALPAGEAKPDAVHERGTAIVAAVHRLRAGETPLISDDLDDPWGRGDQTFQRVGEEIEDTTVPLATLLLP
ncbi:arsenate reductase/protein-tyrosine-phosphatase family protein [Actinoplanes awajinensis]|uniref:protein-tyrosine-phosphatase n=1 Tax=Actinoplanes awajinensis subsp. mycoplanecinus TaxID=135947 RepID=A0A0X3VBM8_9ACTN|nr:phosphotyrosine protein phosphatase [Actinoplanes awajinensis]KUL40696.1 phosphotyrosine protein phosphatase [Actinoplanes awajinensis subsp. mycoplanecinus]